MWLLFIFILLAVGLAIYAIKSPVQNKSSGKVLQSKKINNRDGSQRQKLPILLKSLGCFCIFLLLARLNHYLYILDVFKALKENINYTNTFGVFLWFGIFCMFIVGDFLLVGSIIGIFLNKNWVVKRIPMTFSVYLTAVVFTLIFNGSFLYPESISLFSFMPFFAPMLLVYLFILYSFSRPDVINYFVPSNELQKFIEGKALFKVKLVGFFQIFLVVLSAPLVACVAWVGMFPMAVSIVVIIGIILCHSGWLMFERLEKGLSLSFFLWNCFMVLSIVFFVIGYSRSLPVCFLTLCLFFLWQITRSNLRLVLLPTPKNAWDEYVLRKSSFKNSEFFGTFVVVLITFLLIIFSLPFQVSVLSKQFSKRPYIYGGEVTGTPILEKKAYKRKFYSKSGNLLAVVSMRYDKEQGLTKEYYKSGELNKTISYKNGKKNGLATTYYKNGKKKNEISYKDGKRNGTAKFYNDSGVLEGMIDYKDGIKPGFEKKYFNDDLHYRKGQKGEETFVYYWPDTNILRHEESYLDGQLSGPMRHYYNNGKVQWEKFHKKGKSEGLYRTFYKNGIVEQEIMYKDDNPCCFWKEYDEKGNLVFDAVPNNDNGTGSLDVIKDIRGKY